MESVTRTATGSASVAPARPLCAAPSAATRVFRATGSDSATIDNTLSTFSTVASNVWRPGYAASTHVARARPSASVSVVDGVTDP